MLNRLATAQEGKRWSDVYTYDPWGNLTKKLYGPVAAGEHLDTSADTGNHLLGYSYDTGGNVTGDGVNTYVYDGENRISSVAGVSYTYDADGLRVKKSSGINYWYGPGGEALAETDSAGTWTNYVFFAGQRLARNVNGDIKYYITDHLHSTAMFVDKAGTAAAVLDDNDFYPWGGVVPGVGQTTSNNTIKFTGKYRDTESGLDYFGARYYANAMGRFMSPDWAAKPVTVPYAKFGDPQSLNLYAYTENGPVNRIDADGHTYAGFDGFMAPRGGGFSDIDNEIEFEVNMEAATDAALQAAKAAEQSARLQALYVSTAAQMATEQGTAHSYSTEPQFSHPTNAFIYRTDQKLDAVLAPLYKRFENLSELFGEAEDFLSRPIVDGPVIAADPFVNPSGVPVPLRIIHNEPPIQQSASYAEWSKSSTEEIIRSLSPGTDRALRVTGDGAVVNGNARITILMERGVNVNALPRELYVPDISEFPDLKIPE